MRFFSSGLFILTLCALLFFCVLSYIVWFAYDEILKTAFLVGNQIDPHRDIYKTLEQLITENRLISAKDYFGFYISYYNNFVLILSAIIGLFGISSFVYLKQKNIENLKDIENKTKDEIKNYLSKGDVDVKKITQEVVEEYVTSEIKERFEIFEKDIDMLKKQVEQIDSHDYGEEEIVLKKQGDIKEN